MSFDWLPFTPPPSGRLLWSFNNPLRRLLKRSPKKPRRCPLVWPGWKLRRLGKSTMNYRMTLGHLMTSLGMALPQGDTTRSSTHGALLDQTDSETGHGRPTRKLARSNTKENMSIACRLITLWLQGCSSISSHPTCLKTMKKLARMISTSMQCWTWQPWWTRYPSATMGGVRIPTTDIVQVGIQPVV
jgi:hypothetical protein